MSDQQHSLSDAIHEGMRKIANSITPIDAVAGADATGNGVYSLSEAVMGLTAALCRIADAIHGHAEATRVAGEVCSAVASETINASAKAIERERDWAMARLAKLQMQLDAALDKLNSHGPEGHSASNWQFFKVRADRDKWRAHAEELVAACTLHYSGDDGEGREKSAETFLRVMRAVEQINKSSEEASK